MSIDDLPNELILSIFDFVDERTFVTTVPAVSRHWAAIAALLVEVWEDKWTEQFISDVGLTGLARKFPNLVELHLRYEHRVTAVGLHSILVGCPNLTLLNLC